VFDTDFGKNRDAHLLGCAFSRWATNPDAQGGGDDPGTDLGGNLTLARARAIENQVYLVTRAMNEDGGIRPGRGNHGGGSESEPVVPVDIDLNAGNSGMAGRL